jgi:hypothetical protein
MRDKVFARFVEKRPISVRVRGMLEHVLGADQRRAWDERTAQKPYTWALRCSTVYDLLSPCVVCIQPSVHAAYRHLEDILGLTRVSVYTQLHGVETPTSAALVRDSATALAPRIAQRDGACAPWLPGCRVQMVDGTGLEATERRRKVLRNTPAGALPGKAWVGSEPARGRVPEVGPCEEGHAQERALFWGAARDGPNR